MTLDSFLSSYVTALNSDLAGLKNDILEANFSDMYQVGKLQGQAVGIKKALDLLQEVYREQDE